MPVTVIDVVLAYTAFAGFAIVVVSHALQIKLVELVHAVMPVTVAVPLLKVTVPHSVLGFACAVLAQVVVVPQVAMKTVVPIFPLPSFVRIPAEVSVVTFR